MKPHVSPSQLETHSRCPEAWQRRYICGDRCPPGIPALQGKGVHAGAELNFRQKKDSHRDLPESDIVDAAAASFTAAVGEGYALTPEESARGVDTVIGRAKDSVVQLAGLLAREVAPVYQPALVEQKVRVVLPNATHDMLGIIDLADIQQRIVDYKSTGRRKTQAEADRSIALTFYASAHRVETGLPASELRMEVLLKRRQPERQLIVTDRTPADFRVLASRVNVMLAAIASGAFPPATPGAWWCGPKYCGYWPTCPYVNSERKALAERPGGSLLRPKRSKPAKRRRVRTAFDRLLEENPYCWRCGKRVTTATAALDFIGAVREEWNQVLSCKCHLPAAAH